VRSGRIPTGVWVLGFVSLLIVKVFSGVLSDYVGKRKGLTVLG